MNTVSQDLRFAIRTLLKNRGFTAAAVLTLAVGIGATTAIFSVVNGTLLRPPPYPEPDRLIVVAERGADGAEMPVAAPNFQDWRSQARSLEALAVYSSGTVPVLGGGEPVRPDVASVSADFFRAIGVQAAVGRTFAEEETRPGGPPAAVVSHAFWETQMEGATRLEGRALQIYGMSYPVVGVMPPGFQFPGKAAVWIPETLASPGTRNAHNWSVVGRVRSGVPVDRARAELDDVQRRLKAEHGGDVDGVGVTVRTLQESLVGSAQRPILLLFGAAGLVLLIACANLASTLLARGAARSREIAVRSALGAERGRLLRQLFTESVVLAAFGSAAGVLLAVVALRLLSATAPAGSMMDGGVRMDGTVLGFTLVATVLSAVLFGLLPAFRLSDTDAGVVLRGSRGVASGGRGAVWSVLVGTEVALALLLLVGAGLLIRSFWGVMSVNPGFRGEGVLTVDLALPEAKYKDDAALAAFHEAFLSEVRGIPGVQAAGVVSIPPLSQGSINGAFEIESRGPESGYGEYRAASAGYFGALRIPVLAGRVFDDRDRAGTPDVAVVNEAMARRYWRGDTPVGKRIRNLANDSWLYGDDRWVTIVGVVGNVRQTALTSEVLPEVYVNTAQRPFRSRYAVTTIRSTLPPAALVSAVRSRLAQRFGDVPAEYQTMDARVASSVGDRRFLMMILGAFAGAALLLAAVGIYGVISYRVAQRTLEIGIRVALGARPGQVRAMVIRSSMTIVAAGLAAGVAGALLLTRVVRSLLFEVTPTDPGTFVGVLLLLLGAALVASYVPAWRATRADPMRALRAE